MTNNRAIAAVLFSGGKDSAYAAYLAKKAGYELACLISVFSKNKESYMFHTPSIEQTKVQAEVMDLPLVITETEGIKEQELYDLTEIIREVRDKYYIDTIVTGALHSDYQASRIQKICDKLSLKCFNPLWHKDEIEYLKELIKNKFKVIITAIAAYPLNQSWLGKVINKQFIDEVQILKDKYKIHAAGEGGEFETFVLNCPLFKRPLNIINKKIYGEKNSWYMEIKVK